MRVGILTMYYKNYSYGGLLQAYSLQQTISQFGYECEQISYDYNERFREKVVKHESIIKKLKKLRRTLKKYKFQRLLAKHGDVTRQKYHDFMNFISHSEYYNAANISEVADKYDKFVVGGDQVWNMDYCDENFFLFFVEKNKKISYSASAGKDQFTQEEMEQLVRGIGTFSYISVRENSFKMKILERLEKQVSLTLDPVFLQNSDFWKQLAVKSQVPKDYVLVYLLGYDQEEKKRVSALASKIGFPVVFIPFANLGYCKGEERYGDVQIWSVGPNEFLGLIQYAKYILTDSFHATAFSILFEKEFYCFSRPNKKYSMNSRLESLLSICSLEDRYVDLNTIDQISVDEIDYSICREKISSFRDWSRTWLKNALEN